MTEQAQVPPAEFRSYYGRPILKVTRWREPHLPAYLFLGELSGAAAVLGAVAAATKRPGLARAGRLISAAAAYGGAGFLTAELGRPERFRNMLRVAKPTSPMSMGSWLLAAHSSLTTVAAAAEVCAIWRERVGPAGALPRNGRLRPVGAAAGAASALTGPVFATYPGVLFANTAVPAWHSAYRQLPVLFAGGALTAVGAAGLAAYALSGDEAAAGPARRLALLGAAAESLAGFGLETQLGLAGEPYRSGDGGRLLRGARAATLLGAATALFARRSRSAAAAAAALLAGGGLCAKFAVLRAGVTSASDPKYVIATQDGGRRPPPT